MTLHHDAFIWKVRQFLSLYQLCCSVISVYSDDGKSFTHLAEKNDAGWCPFQGGGCYRSSHLIDRFRCEAFQHRLCACPLPKKGSHFCSTDSTDNDIVNHGFSRRFDTCAWQITDECPQLTSQETAPWCGWTQWSAWSGTCGIVYRRAQRRCLCATPTKPLSSCKIEGKQNVTSWQTREQKQHLKRCSLTCVWSRWNVGCIDKKCTSYNRRRHCRNCRISGISVIHDRKGDSYCKGNDTALCIDPTNIQSCNMGNASGLQMNSPLDNVPACFAWFISVSGSFLILIIYPGVSSIPAYFLNVCCCTCKYGNAAKPRSKPHMTIANRVIHEKRYSSNKQFGDVTTLKRKAAAQRANNSGTEVIYLSEMESASPFIGHD